MTVSRVRSRLVPGLVCAVAALLMSAGVSLAADKSAAVKVDKDGFVSLFDGKTLTGWHAVPENSLSDWAVQEGGILSGKGSQKRLTYLVWKDELDDFELRFDYRMRTDGNTGVEIRAKKDVTGKRPFEGYHADFGHVGIGPNVLGAWDFHFARRQELPCPRGTNLVIAKDGSWTSEKLDDAIMKKDIRKRDWNSVRIIARGKRLQFFINDKPAAEFTDHKPERLKKGIIGLQIHDKGMHVEFRRMKLKRFKTKS